MIQMTETETLLEVMHKVNEAKFRQHVGGKLAARISGLIQVCVEISHKYGVFAPEALQRLFYIKEVVQSDWWEVFSNDWGPGRA